MPFTRKSPASTVPGTSGSLTVTVKEVGGVETTPPAAGVVPVTVRGVAMIGVFMSAWTWAAVSAVL